MKALDSSTLARLAAGEIDYLDAVTFLLPSGDMSLLLGARGEIPWTDSQVGAQTFYGTGDLVSIDVPATAFGPEASPITLKLAETYLPVGGGDPVNIFEVDGRNTIDDEAWQGTFVILSIFWLDAGGTVIERETVDIRVLDDLPVEIDADGNPIRIAVLERPDIRQRQPEGKTRSADFQSQIDATDKGLQHLRKTKRQVIKFGRRPRAPVSGGDSGGGSSKEGGW